MKKWFLKKYAYNTITTVMRASSGLYLLTQYIYNRL